MKVLFRYATKNDVINDLIFGLLPLMSKVSNFNLEHLCHDRLKEE